MFYRQISIADIKPIIFYFLYETVKKNYNFNIFIWAFFYSNVYNKKKLKKRERKNVTEEQ